MLGTTGYKQLHGSAGTTCYYNAKPFAMRLLRIRTFGRNVCHLS
jgi:hypothetical protein